MREPDVPAVTHRPRITVRWTAAPDLLAHATKPRATRTLCGLATLPERHAWPAIGRCAVCQHQLDALEGTVRIA
jgi:hypothetical protein